MGGTKNSTSTSTQQLPSWVQSAYQGLFANAQNTAQTPYRPYTGGFTSDQQQAFQGIRNAQGVGNGAFGAANAAYGTATTPTYQTVGNYESPYINDVVNSTMRNMQEQNAQEQQGVIGNAIAKGSFGGNRVGVAQSELARQQDLANQSTIANIRNTGFQQALSANQNQQQMALQAGQGYTGLGQTQMQNVLSQAGAQLGAGTQQQQFGYQQYLNQQGFPYQQQSWLAGILGGLGPTAGGTTTQQTPQGNIWSQLLGAGLGIASLFKDGGRVHAAGGGVMPFANDNGQWPAIGFGGTPYHNDNSFGSYVPQSAMNVASSRFPTISDQGGQQEDPLTQYSSVMKEGAGNIKDWLTPHNPIHLGYNLDTGGVVPGQSPQGVDFGHDPQMRRPLHHGHYPHWLNGDQSTNIEDRRALTHFTPGMGNVYPFPTANFSRANGGGVRGYEDGGIPTMPDSILNAEFASTDDPMGNLKYLAPDVLNGPLSRKTKPDDTIDTVNALNGDNLGLGMGNSSEQPSVAAYADTPDDLGHNQPPSGVLPPSFGPSGEVPFTGGDQFTTTPTPGYSQNIGDAWKSLQGGKGLNLSPDFKQSLLAAGLGMMSSRSPFALQGIGEGGLKGIETWMERQKLEKDLASQRASNAKTGADIAVEAATIGQTQATTAATRYSFQPGVGGVQVTDVYDPKHPYTVPYGEVLPDGTIANPATGPASTTNAGPTPLFSTAAPKLPRRDPGLTSPITAPGIVQAAETAVGDARVQQQGATATNQQLEEMQHDFDQLPEDGFMVQGTGFDDRLGWTKALNTALTGMGMDPIYPAAVAAGEDINKLNFRLGAELSRTLGSNEAASIVENAAAATPSGIMSKKGAQTVMAGLKAINKRRINYYQFLQNWKAINYSLLGADEYFNAHNPPELYALSAYVPQPAMEDLRAHPEHAADFNKKYGNGRNVARYILGQ